MNFSSFITCVLLIGAVWSGCRKAEQDRTEEPAPKTTTPQPLQSQSSEDNSQADFVFNDVNNIIEDAARSQGGVNKMLLSSFCYSAKKDSSSFTGYPQTITIDFGNGCQSPDTRVRKGKIIFVVTQKRTTLNAVDSIRFVNFSINQYKVEGTIVNKLDSLGKIGGINVPAKWSYKVINALVKDTITNKFHKWEADKQRIYSYRQGSPDIWYYSGTTKGTNVNGEDYTYTIQKPIQVIQCGTEWTAVSGSFTIEVISGNKSTLKVDYGTGACDKLGTATFNGGTPVEVTFK